MRDRGRLARNPIALLLFVGLVVVAAAQLILGPEGSAVVTSMPHNVQLSFAVLLGGSAGLVLAGAAMPEPRAYWLEAGGKAGCAIALFVYSSTLPAAVEAWITSLAVVFAAIAVACVLRLMWLTYLIVNNFYPRLYTRVGLVVLRVRDWIRR